MAARQFYVYTCALKTKRYCTFTLSSNNYTILSLKNLVGAFNRVEAFNRINVTQYNKRYILSTFEKIVIFALSNRRFNKLSNYTKFVKIGVILLKIQHLQSQYFLLFSIYFAHYLRINLADKMSLLLYWVTFSSVILECLRA